MNFTRSDDLTTGRFRVRSEASAAVTPGPGQPHMSDTMISRTPLFLEINGTRHPLEAPGLTIGRGTNADLRIDDPGGSRLHVEFRVQPGSGAPSLSVVDLGSTNGTTVNGQRVQQAALEDGSVVQIGSTRITVHVGGTSSRGASAGSPDNLGTPSGGPGDPGGPQPPDSSGPAGPPPGVPQGQRPAPQQPASGYPPYEPQTSPPAGSPDNLGTPSGGPGHPAGPQPPGSSGPGGPPPGVPQGQRPAPQQPASGYPPYGPQTSPPDGSQQGQSQPRPWNG
jgi:hypothetical protein